MAEHRVSLSDIVLSHWHADHVGGVPGILSHLNIRGDCRVWKGSLDADVNSNAARKDSEGHIRDGDLDSDITDTLTDGMELVTEGATLRLIHSPGHTTDHFAALLLEEGALFSGDCVLGEGTAVFEDLGHLIASLRSFLRLEPKLIYPGHGPVVTDPMAKLSQYIEHRLQRERQVLDALVGSKDEGSGLSVRQIVRIIYTQTPEKLMRAAGANVSHHLEKLVSEGRVGWATRAAEEVEEDGKVFFLLPSRDAA